MKKYIFFILLSVVCLYTKALSVTPQVNEQVELMSILSRMAGFPEYRMDIGGQYYFFPKYAIQDQKQYKVLK